MRSIKLLTAAAVVAALVSGPVLAQDAVDPVSETATPAVSVEKEAPVKAGTKCHKKCHKKAKIAKKHHKAAKAASEGAAMK